MKILRKLWSLITSAVKGSSPGYVQKTSGTGLSNLIMSYYDRILLETFFPDLRYYQFGEKKSLPRNSGKTVTWNMYKKLSVVTTNITEGTVPTQAVLSTNKITATLIQRGAYTKVSDMIVMTTIDDSIASAVKLCAKQAALTLDTYIRDTVSMIIMNASQRSALSKLYSDTAATSGTRVRIFSGSSFEDGFRIRHNKGRINTSTSVTAIAGSAMTVATVRDAVNSLQALDIQPHADGNYVGIIHPVVAGQLRGTNNWQSWQKYTHPEMMYKGEIGLVEQCRFVQSTNAPAYAVSGNKLTTSGSVYGTIIFGRGAYGVTEVAGKNALEYNVVLPNKYDSSNPLKQWTTVAWKMTCAARILNKSAGVVVVTAKAGTA